MRRDIVKTTQMPFAFLLLLGIEVIDPGSLVFEPAARALEALGGTTGCLNLRHGEFCGYPKLILDSLLSLSLARR